MKISAAISIISVICVAGAAAYAVCFCLRELGWVKRSLPRPDGRIFTAHPLLTVALMVVLSRFAVYCIGTAVQGFDGTLAGFAELWSGPDTEHYVRISIHGYEPGTEYENLIVFYPLYPLLIRIFTPIFGVPELAGMFVSNLCLAGACFLLYKLCVECGMDKAQGLLAVAFLLVFPFSVFTASCYTESLFLLLTVACALCLKRRKWLFAGVAGMLAAMTRTQGVLCLVMAAYEAVSAWKEEEKPLRCLWCLLIPVGFCAYLAINLALYGDALAFTVFEKAAPWYQGTDWFFNNLAQHVNMAMQYPGLAQFIYLPQVLLFFAVLAVLTAGLKRKIRTSFMLYGYISLIVCYTASWLISGGRYLLAVFPIFMALGVETKKRPVLGAVLFLCCCVLNIFYMLAFLRGEAVM